MRNTNLGVDWYRRVPVRLWRGRAENSTGRCSRSPSCPRPTHRTSIGKRSMRRSAGSRRSPADVHRYGFPRTDLTVTLDGVTIKPALALGGWIAFKPAHGGVMAMGDLVLLESEINPVMLEDDCERVGDYGLA